MVLLLLALLSILLGYSLGMTRRGFITMVATAMVAATLQVVHFLTNGDRSTMTLAPLLIGLVSIAFTLAGAFLHRTARGRENAA